MFQEFVVCTFFYVVIVAIAYQPKRTAATESQPIEYFPEVGDTEEETAPEPTPIVIFERRPVAAFVATKSPSVDYSKMSIRQLKESAKALTGTPKAIAKYSRLNRQQLIEALTR